MFSKKITVIQPKPLGEFLLEADLVSKFQVELALQDQLNYSHLRLGEILALRGWLKQETADFFALDWHEIVRQRNKKPLGHYLIQSALIEGERLEDLLSEHFQTGIRLGTVAVIQGLIKQKTLNYLIEHLYPKEVNSSPFISPYRTSSRRYKSLDKTTLNLNEATSNKYLQDNNNYWSQINTNFIATEEIEDVDESIIWID